jgi:hypothetical protein
MTKRETLSFSLKLLGVYLLFEIILSFLTTWNDLSIIFNSKQFPEFYPSIYFFGFIISRIWELGIVFVLFRYSDPIVKRLIPEDNEISFADISQSEKSLFSIAILVIGIGCFVTGVPNVIRNLSRSINRTYGQIPLYSDRTIISIVLLALGVYLFTGGEHLIKLAFKKKPETQQEEPDDRDK